jgi:hypothetical protein
MKKLFILLLFSASGYVTSFGQQLSVGFKTSFLALDTKLIADLSGYPPMEVKPRSSYGIGVTLSEQIKRFGIKVEPRFIVKGYNLDFGLSEIDVYRNNYLSLPILFSFSPASNLHLEIGPEFSYLLNSRVKYYGSNSFKKNNSNNLKPYELSFITGASYSLIKHLDLGIRYGLSLTPFDKGQFLVSDAPFPPADYKFIHRYWEFFLNTKIFVKNSQHLP